MRNTTIALAELVPDITIRTRAEVEAEEAAADAEDEAHSEDEKPVKSSRKAGGFSSKGVGQKGGPSKMRGPLPEDILENKLLNGVREGSTAASQDGGPWGQANGIYTTPPPGGTPIGDLEGQLDPAQVAEQAREEGGNDSDEGDILSREWSSQTQQARAKYALRRNKLLRKPLVQDEPALIRTKRGMSKFKEWEDKAYDIIHFRESEPAPDPDADDVLIDDEEEDGEDQFLAEYDIASGMLDGLGVLDDENLRKLYSKRNDLPE
jgi:transcriptional activator SPT7